MTRVPHDLKKGDFLRATCAGHEAGSVLYGFEESPAGFRADERDG